MREPHTIIRRLPLGTDSYGNQLYEEVDRLETVGHLRLILGIEHEAEQDTAVATYGDYLPVKTILPDGTMVDTIVTEFDKIITNGQPYEIIEVGYARNPRTNKLHHILLKVVGVKG